MVLIDPAYGRLGPLADDVVIWREVSTQTHVGSGAFSREEDVINVLIPRKSGI